MKSSYPLHLAFSFIHAGQILNGLAGCVVMATPPYLSNIWFPPHERITATAVTTLVGYTGELIAFNMYYKNICTFLQAG